MKELSDLNIPALSLSPSSYGYLISRFKEFSYAISRITELRYDLINNLRRYESQSNEIVRDHLACLAVVNFHHMARKLRNVSEYVQKMRTHPAIAGRVSDLIRTTDEVDQVWTNINEYWRITIILNCLPFLSYWYCSMIRDTTLTTLDS